MEICVGDVSITKEGTTTSVVAVIEKKKIQMKDILLSMSQAQLVDSAVEALSFTKGEVMTLTHDSLSEYVTIKKNGLFQISRPMRRFDPVLDYFNKFIQQ